MRAAALSEKGAAVGPFCFGAEEAVPGPSVFPSGEPGVSGDFWASSAKTRGFHTQLDEGPETP